MYEVPRHFGAHEGFLKLVERFLLSCAVVMTLQLGVKETPSAAEYEAFLQELAHECQGYSLNPNEMRAVLTIINVLERFNDLKTSFNVGYRE